MRFGCVALRATLYIFLTSHGRVVDAHWCEDGNQLRCMDVHDLDKAPESVGGRFAEAHPMCTTEGKQVYCLPHHGHHDCELAGRAKCCDTDIKVPGSGRRLEHGSSTTKSETKWEQYHGRRRRRRPYKQDNDELVCSPTKAIAKPTASPSPAPTAVPTSASPSSAPTAIPSQAPTAAPTPLDITKYGKTGVLNVTLQVKFAGSKHGEVDSNVDAHLNLTGVLMGQSSLFEAVLEAQFNVHRVEVLNLAADDAGRRLSESEASNKNRKSLVRFFAYGQPSLSSMSRTSIADALQGAFSTAGVEIDILSTWLNIEPEMSKRDDVDNSWIGLPVQEPVKNEDKEMKEFSAMPELQRGSDKAQGTRSEDMQAKECPPWVIECDGDGMITLGVSMCAALIFALAACLCFGCISKYRAARNSDGTDNDVEKNNTEIANAYGKSDEQNANSEEVAGEVLRGSSTSSPAAIDIGDTSKPKSAKMDDEETNSVSTAAPPSDMGGPSPDRPSWHSDEAMDI